ncbi:hypothetical protein MANI_027865 [Metarhizium anisopliae]
MQVNTPPSVNVGVLIRGPPHAILEALADPSMTTRFCGKRLSTAVCVDAVVPDHLIRFRWGMYDEVSPSTVEFRIIPCPCHDLRICASWRRGFTGHGDSQVKRAAGSTAGFTFVLSALKAALEHDVTLRVTAEAFRDMFAGDWTMEPGAMSSLLCVLAGTVVPWPNIERK